MMSLEKRYLKSRSVSKVTFRLPRAAAVDADPDKFHKRAPLGRMGTTEEIGGVVVFLASERASYMTGATVDVSGGLAMH